ncbi:MAG: hypothetical protein LBB05_02310, partial [Puniceicoccales bacterium]|nr:hypothetical protein [Puniceicoccales bacterium]
DTAEGRKPVDGLESDITELREGKLVVKMFAKRGLFGSMRYPGVINCEDGGVLMQFGGLSDERIRRLDEMIRRFEAMNPNLAKK